MDKTQEEQIVQELLNDFVMQSARFKHHAKAASKKDLARAVINALHSDLTDLVKDNSIHKSEEHLTDILKRMYNSRIILLNKVYEMQMKELETQSSQGETNNEESK
jgi:hypothetical protein